MANLTLNVPVLVRSQEEDGKPVFTVLPLFYQEFSVARNRYRDAMSKFSSLLKERFRNFQLERDSMEYFLWYRFDPPPKLHHFEFQFTIANRRISGRFGVVQFEWKGRMYGFLPNVEQHFFMVESGVSLVEFEQHSKRIIEQLLKKNQQNNRDHFDASNYFSPEKEFINYVKHSIKIKDANFSFEEDSMGDLFATLREEHDFDGEDELEKVAVELGEKYPMELQRSYFQEEKVEQVANLFHGKKTTPVVLPWPYRGR